MWLIDKVLSLHMAHLVTHHAHHNTHHKPTSDIFIVVGITFAKCQIGSRDEFVKVIFYLLVYIWYGKCLGVHVFYMSPFHMLMQKIWSVSWIGRNTRINCVTILNHSTKSLWAHNPKLAPTGDAPTTSEWSTILLPTKVRLILETLRYFSYMKSYDQQFCTRRVGMCKIVARWHHKNTIKGKVVWQGFDHELMGPSDPYMRQLIMPSLVQITACRLVGAMPLSEPMLKYCWLDPSIFIHFYSRKCIWKYRVKMAVILSRPQGAKWPWTTDCLWVVWFSWHPTITDWLDQLLCNIPSIIVWIGCKVCL